MLASRRPGRRYARTDLRFLQVFAGRLAVALDNARLLTAERQLEALIGAMEDAVTVLDPDGRILIANPAAVELIGAGRSRSCSRRRWRRCSSASRSTTPTAARSATSD